VLRPYNCGVPAADLSGKRVLVLGAETEIGRSVTSAVAEAGASVAAVAATGDAEAAFAVQRLARRLASGERKVIAQAIDATNEAAVRVMVRQVSKELGGLDAVVYAPAPGVDVDDPRLLVYEWVINFGGKELQRHGDGSLVLIVEGAGGLFGPQRRGPVAARPEFAPRVSVIGMRDSTPQRVTTAVLNAIAGEADSG